MAAWAATNYSLHFPPVGYYPVLEDSCCVQLLNCENVGADDYGLFRCANLVGVKGGLASDTAVLTSCSEFEAYAEAHR